MSISEVIIESLNCLAESMVIVFYLYNMMKEDYRFRKKALIPAVLLGFILLGSVTLFFEYPSVHLIATFVLMMVISSFMFECKIGKRVFCSSIFLIIILASESLPMGILYMLNFGSPLEQLTSGAGRYIGMACSKLFCFWFSVYIIEYSKNKQKDIPLKNWLSIILIPILSVVILNGIFVSYGLTHRQTINYLISVIGLLALNLFVFNFFDTYANQLKLKVMEQRLKSEEENYMLIESKYNEIRQLKHDINNQISVARSMFRYGNQNEAIRHLENLSNSLSDAGGICYTGISSVDAIINMKWQEALNKSIQFTTKINVFESISIDNMLLCRILSNLLDNAIEGAERCSCVNKYIYISMTQVDNKLRICVMNSSDEVDTQNLKSSKSGNGLHGIGVSSIKKAVAQLNGVMSFEWEDETFTVDILIEY